MPKRIIDYQKTVMYKIVCNDLNIIKSLYVGHTTDFTNRKRQHKQNITFVKSLSHIPSDSL